jgi:hypothetical protein
MAAAVARLVEALEGERIPFCQWKGARALERALRGERDLDWLVRASDWERALRAIEAAGWKRALPRRGTEEEGIAHFFAFDPALDPLLHLHLHDQVLSGEDWINSHALPLGEDFLASRRRAYGVPVPEAAGEAALLVLKHAVRWGSLPDRVTTWLRPTREAEESVALLEEPTLLQAASLVHSRCPALDEATFRACAVALRTGSRGLLPVLAPLAARAARRRLRLARRVRHALRPWSRQRGLQRPLAYLRVLKARLQRWLDGERRDRAPTAGALLIALSAPDPAHARRAAEELASWLGQAFAVRTLDAEQADDRSLRAAAAGREIVLWVGTPPSPAAGPTRRLCVTVPEREASPRALRAAVWNAL